MVVIISLPYQVLHHSKVSQLGSEWLAFQELLGPLFTLEALHPCCSPKISQLFLEHLHKESLLGEMFKTCSAGSSSTPQC